MNGAWSKWCFDPTRTSSPAVIPTPALISIALATVIRSRRFDQDGVSLPDGRPPWERLGGGAPSFGPAEASCCPAPPAIAWGPHRLANGSLHRCRCYRLLPDFIAGPRKPGSRATEPACRSGGRRRMRHLRNWHFGASGSGRRLARRCAKRGRRTICRIGAVAPVDGARSRSRGRKRPSSSRPASSSSRPARNKWSATMRQSPSSLRQRRNKWSATMRQSPNSLRQARNKWPALSPRLPSRTCGPRHQRLHHGLLPPRRVSRCRSFRRRKPDRSRWPQCRGGSEQQ